MSQFNAGCNKMEGLPKPALLLTVVAIGLFSYFLNSKNGIFQEFEAALLAVQGMLLVCLAVWSGVLIFLTFDLNDLPLTVLLLIAMVAYFIGYAADSNATDAVMLLATVTLGKGSQFLLKIGNRKSEIRNFLMGLVGLLASSSWWHWDMPGPYHGPRWMGLWNNPNIYGMLMGAGGVLAVGLQAGTRKEEYRMKNPEGLRSVDSGPQQLLFAAIKSAVGNWQSAFFLVAVLMLGVGLVMSYSRGAWVATAVGLLYLAWSYGKLKWRYVMLGAGLVALVILLCWGRTPDSAPWYIKRADLGRPSAQHRVSAWHGALQMMRDHPFGVGWNNAVSTYGKNYSPPEGGAAALTMNSYLMLGAESGIPALLCFLAYVGLCFNAGRITRCAPFPPGPNPGAHGGARPATDSADGTSALQCDEASQLRCACRAGALVFAVAFWFDGGLFDLPTAALFWVLLELGAERGLGKKIEDGSLKMAEAMANDRCQS